MNDLLKVNDILPRQIVIDMAEAFGIDYDEDNGEFCIELPDSMGSGFVKAHEFDSGIGVIECDYTLKEELIFELQKNKICPLKIVFNREQSIFHKFKNDDEEIEIRHLEAAMLGGTSLNNNFFRIPAHTPICIFSVEINRKIFEEKVDSLLDVLSDDLIPLLRDVNGVNNFQHKGNYGIDIAKFLEEFTECEKDGLTRRIFLEAKAFEIFSQYIDLYQKDLGGSEKRTILRQKTSDKIQEAAQIIEDEVESSVNVSSLAKRVGLNQNTLQNGFKTLYKTSVNEYIRNFRIEAAKELLETTDLNITQITYKVGINSRSYFSKVFKKRYGVTPKDFVNEVRKKDSKKKQA